MTVQRLVPYEVGDLIKHIPSDPDQTRCDITLPNGMPITMDAEHGFVNVTLFMPGTWVWRWPNGETGEWIVVGPEPGDQEVQAGSTVPRPAASLSSRQA
jgi:hypothetical protein